MKGVRIKTKCGEIRHASLAPHSTLIAWYNSFRSEGHIVGEQWALPFGSVAIVDLVDINVSQNHERDDIGPRNKVDALSQAIQGGWRPKEAV